MANIKHSVESIEAQMTDLTPYQVYVVWQAEIVKVDSTREIRPQMAYNYDRNGLIVKGRASKGTGEAGRYTFEEARAFVAKWMMKNYKVNIDTPVEIESTEVEGQLDLLEMVN